MYLRTIETIKNPNIMTTSNKILKLKTEINIAWNRYSNNRPMRDSIISNLQSQIDKLS